MLKTVNDILVDLYNQGVGVTNIQISGENTQIVTLVITARCDIEQAVDAKCFSFEDLGKGSFNLTYELFPFVMYDGVLLDSAEVK